MDPLISTHLSRTHIVFSAFFLMIVPISVAAEDRPAKPTPRPGTLGARAQSITLNRAALGSDQQRVVLDNDAISRIGKNTSLTFGAVEPSKGTRPPAGAAATTSERARWRAAHRKQRRVIVELERRRALLENEIDHLENQRLTIKNMARLQNAEAKLQLLDREIAVERAELARIVREARRHGAEPGWFR